MPTQPEVDAACEAIAARGDVPTVELVRLALGASPNTVTPLVRAWKEANRPKRAAAMDLPPADPVAVSPAVQRALEMLSGAIVRTVTEAEDAERRRARAAADAAVAEAMEQVADARKLAADEREATEAVRREVEDLQAAIAAKGQEIARLSTLLSERDATLAELRTAAAVADQRAEGERQRAERAEAEADRLRRERAEGEIATRDAIGRAAKAEGEAAALRAELAAGAPGKPRRGGGASERTG